MKIQLDKKLEDIASVENLLEAWKEFLPGKKSKPDAQEFGLRLMENILSLCDDLINRVYRHGGYRHFRISDPKPRDIHKAGVRDRLLHHAIYRVLYPFFDKTFISDSFSCRTGKGTHAALNRFRSFSRAASKNNTRMCRVLKCDIRKFFANIDHEILLSTLRPRITDENIMWLLDEVIKSFSTPDKPGVGLPLGNLTSQLLVNIYMNEFDQFAKHRLKAKYYVRYADDFVILSDNKEKLENLLPQIRNFLINRLKLELHPDKVFIKTLASGVDFLGWVHFPDHRVLRTATKRRMLKRLSQHPGRGTFMSYAGLLRHGNTLKIQRRIPRFIVG